MKIAIFGIEGQLGRDLADALAAHDVIAATEARADVTDAAAVTAIVDEARPQWVVNAAAMTHVDRCEDEAREAFAVNAVGAGNVARACAAVGARLLHVSTDYVFDGTKGAPYVESDAPGPLNVYGASKLAGEHLVRAQCAAHAIVRTSGLYGLYPCLGKGTNFVETMLALARDRDRVRVVCDERLSPTFAEDLAAVVRGLIEDPLPPGTFHVANEGGCAWDEFAREIFRLAGKAVVVEPIRAAEWGAPARRPADSTLENRALRAAGRAALPPWRDALRRYLERRGQRS